MIRLTCECRANNMSYAAYLQLSKSGRRDFDRKIENCQTCTDDRRADIKCDEVKS